MSAPKLSFTFSKQKRPALNSKSSDQVTKQKVETREFITSIEDNIISSNKPPEPALIIPLRESSNGIRQRIRQKASKDSITQPKVVDDLTRQAIEELTNGGGKPNGDISQPDGHMIIAMNTLATISGKVEGDDVNYEQIPVEKFGLAMLAGMGFDPKKLNDAAAQTVGPIRPKGLGLGADPTVVARMTKKQSESDTEKKLTWTTAARCQAVLGKYKGQYATINGFDGDTGRVIVKFTLSKQIVSVLQHTLRLVTEQEYSTYANCLNQSEVDDYKVREAKQQRVEEVTQQTLSSKSADEYPVNNSTLNSFYSHSSNRSSALFDTTAWVRPNLLVKFLDKHYKDGRYYKQKMTISAVSSGRCSLKTSSGRLIEDVHPKYLQTVVPKHNNSMVMILHGPRYGEMAKLVNQNLDQNEVDLRTRAGTTIQLTFDQICAVTDDL